MAFVDTQPAPLDGGDAALAQFRCGHPREVQALLRELRDGGTPLALSAPEGHSIGASVWTVDIERNRLVLDVEPGEPRLQALVESNEVTALAYLDAVKLQFELHDLVLVRGNQATALQARLPVCIYRFQRRGAYRVKTAERGAPVARLRHPAMPDMLVSLRILDLSTGGCALLLPDNVPPLAPGLELSAVQLVLDTDTHFSAGLRIHHAASLSGKGGGLRLGCELLRLDGHAQRTLQRYIDQAQKRRRLLSLD